MRHTLLILFIFLNSIDLFSQSFKEVLSFHENGKPRTVSYKNENLELVKTNEYDDTGKLLSEFNYDPVTKLRNGEFFDINNKGFYDQGMLNCFDCTLIFGNESSSGFKWFGDFINGKPRGEISIYKINKIQRLQYDPVTSYLLSYESRSRISYSSYVDTGETTEEFIMKLNYNENGELDGIVKPNNNTEVIINNGFIEGIIKYEEYNRSYVKDSIFLESKIWKQNGSYVKNQGLPIFQYNEFNNPTYVGYETINYDNFIEEEDTFVILDQNNENLLDNYGVFSIRDRVNAKSFNNESKNKIEFFFEDLLKPDNFNLVNGLFINILNNKYLDYHVGLEVSLNRIRNDKYSIEDDLINLYERILNKLSPFYFIIHHSNFLKDEDVLNKYQSFIVNPKDYRWEYASIINFEGIVSILNDFIKFPTYILYKNFENNNLEVKEINLELFEKELNRINNYRDLNEVHNMFLKNLQLSCKNLEELKIETPKLRKEWYSKVFEGKKVIDKIVDIFFTPLNYSDIHKRYINFLIKNSKNYSYEYKITKEGRVNDVKFYTDSFDDVSSQNGIKTVLMKMGREKYGLSVPDNLIEQYIYDDLIVLTRLYQLVIEKTKKTLPLYFPPLVGFNKNNNLYTVPFDNGHKFFSSKNN